MSREIFDYFARYIERETGINYADSNMYQLQSRLEEMSKNEKLTIEELYLKFANGTSGFLRQKLVDIATNNETSFFRDPSYFKVMSQYLIDEILPFRPSSLNIWSAASSTGQEAISIAITLDELSDKVDLPPWKITGTDICQKALSRCAELTYSDFELMRGMSPERKDKYFSPHNGVWRAKDQIRNHLQFFQNNLISSAVPGPFDLVFCRNVLIYQKVSSKKQILNTLIGTLNARGALLLGVGETLVGVTDDVKSLFCSGVVLYKKPDLIKKAI